MILRFICPADYRTAETQPTMINGHAEFNGTSQQSQTTHKKLQDEAVKKNRVNERSLEEKKNDKAEKKKGYQREQEK